MDDVLRRGIPLYSDRHRCGFNPGSTMTFHLATGESKPEAPKPKPQFHPALGYIPQEGNDG